MTDNDTISTTPYDDSGNSCNNNVPYAYFYLTHLDVGEVLFLAAGCVLTVVTVSIFMYELRSIWRSCKYSEILYLIIWLLGLYPVASCTSMIAILTPRSVLLCEFVASSYLGICLYKFVGLIIMYYGGTESMVEKKAGSKLVLRSPPLACCCCCCPEVNPSRQNLRRIEYLVLQCAVIKPPLMFISAILWTEDLYKKSFSLNNPGTYVALINSISTISAMYGLILLFRSSREDLKHYFLGIKFFCLQLGLIFLNLQPAILNLISSYDIPGCWNMLSSRVRCNVIHHLLITLEMFILAMIAKHFYLKRGTLDSNRDVVQSIDLSKEANGEPVINYAAVNEGAVVG